MANNLYRKVGEMDYDGLITNIIPSIQTAGGTIAKLAAAATYVRGTVLAKSTKDGKLYILGTTVAETSESFNGDGATVAFTVVAMPKSILYVAVGGVKVAVASYNSETGVVTLASAPVTGTGNVVVFFSPEQLIPDCILCDNEDISTSVDVPVAVYTAGCFNTEKITVADGYTMMEADKDKLRERGIVFKAAFPAN
ncbi:MAG TPA: hypothetical protein VN626_08050 [Clostridia bacterium]|nr:hypothetical protein [Clostridia bacterium]